MSSSLITSQVKNNILLVTINRPEKHNAINVEVSRALADVVNIVESDDSIYVVVLSSAGDKTFSAGADLKEVAQGLGADIGGGKDGLGGLIYRDRKKPWIAAVTGMALGGGFELALACDLIVAGKSTLFGLPEVKRGLIAGAAGCYRIVQSLPKNIAQELLITGEPLSAELARSYGLVNRVVEDTQVIDTALSLAESIAANAPLSVQASLKLAKAVYSKEAELRQLQDTLSEAVFSSSDAKEGLLAFAEKRKPQWQGH